MFERSARQLKEQDTCNTCIHVAMISESAPINDLQCRRFPPTIHKNELDELKMYFPTVRDNDWCGEFQRNKKGRLRLIK